MMISGLDHILISGHRSDDDLRAPDAPAQLLVREDGGAVEEERLGHVDALAKHRLGDEAPLADGRGHADDRVLDQGMGGHVYSLEQRGPLDANAVGNHAVGADDRRGAQDAALADDGGRVNHDVPAHGEVWRGLGKGGGRHEARDLEVRAHGVHVRADRGELDPVACEQHRLELLLVRHRRQQLVHRVLDARGRHAAEDSRREHIHTAVDQVGHKRLGLLDEVEDSAGALVGHNHTVVVRALQLGGEQGALSAVLDVGQQ
mmetsp:Transcript_28776/g.92908  ORF Transcript_28776/g.92908 Transcript_28776/m.92908 type:complete len:260 (+) Transcript_28776:452-1231(+)